MSEDEDKDRYQYASEYSEILGYGNVTAHMALFKSKIEYDKAVDNYIRNRESSDYVKKPTGGAKLIWIDKRYTIFRSGLVYDDNIGKFLKSRAVKLNRYKKYYRYVTFTTFTGRKVNYNLSKLVFFTFGDHAFCSIDQLPQVIHKNKDTDFSISNLKLKSHNYYGLNEYGEKMDKFGRIIFLKYNLMRFEIIKTLVRHDIEISKISKLLGCTDSSVENFMVRHNFEYEKLEENG